MGCVRAMLVVGAVLLGGGCASERTVSPAPAREVGTATRAEPRGGAGAPARQDPDAFGPAASAPVPADIGAPSSETDAPQGRSLVDATGRPTWWFAEVRMSGDRVSVCSEVLGATLLDVRRGALEAARMQMRAALELGPKDSIPGERVERTWAAPLPTARSGDVRYSGYLELSAPSGG